MSLAQAAQGARAASRRRTVAPVDPYGDVVVADGPIGWWRGNGTTGDETGGSAGSLMVGATYGASLLPARPTAQTFSLDGVDDYVSVPDQSKLDLATTLSVEAWFIAASLSGFGTVIGKGINYGIQHNGTSIGIFSNGTPATLRLYSPTAITTGVLYHVVGTFGAGTAHIYVNAVDKASTAFTSATVGTDPLRLGSFTGSAEFFDGRVAEAAVYSRVLTATEVAEHYTAGTTP